MPTGVQEKVLAILPIFSGLISLIASTWIVVEVLTVREKRCTVYNRLLLGMSVVDVMTSMAYMFGPTPMPYDEGLAWTFGNASTCAAQGFFVQLGIIPPVYHICLAVYYLLIVRFEVTQDKIVKYAEKIMHGIPILIGLGTAFASAALDLFQSTVLWCWIKTETDIRARLFFFYLPLWISMILVLGINSWIFYTVRRREQNANELHAIHIEKHGVKCVGRAKRTSVLLRSSKNTSLSFSFGYPPSRIFTPSENGTREFAASEKGTSEFKAYASSGLLSIEEDGEQYTPSEKGTSELKAYASSGLLFIEEGLELPTNSDNLHKSNIKGNEVNAYQQPIGEQMPTIKPSSSDDSGLLSPQNKHNREREKQNKIPESMDSSKESNLAFRFKFFFKSRDSENSFLIPDMDKQASSADEENFLLDRLSTMGKFVLPESLANRLSHKISNRQQRSDRSNKETSARSLDVKHVLSTVQDFPSATKQYAATYHIGARIILYQSIAYVTGFWLVWTFPTIYQGILFKYPQKNLYWLMSLQAFFEPLQGFFNFTVYRYAHYLRLRELHPSWTKGKLFRHTLLWTFHLRKRTSAKREKIATRLVEETSGDLRTSVIDSGTFEKKGDRVLDYHSDDSGDSELDMPQNNSLSVKKSTMEKRLSSFLGDLMTEFADDPAILNQNFTEISGESLFSYPLFPPTEFATPLVFDNEKFSEFPSSHPVAVPMTNFPVVQSSMDLPNSRSVPMTNFPVVQSSMDFSNGQANEYHDSMIPVELEGDLKGEVTSRSKDSNELSGEINDNAISLQPSGDEILFLQKSNCEDENVSKG